MEQYALISKLNSGVVFSDPSYDEKVWCQYRKEFSDTNWLMKLETEKVSLDEEEKAYRDEEYVDFNLFIGRPTMINLTQLKTVEDRVSLYSSQHYDIKDVEIGMDTACIFCGSMENWRQFPEEAAISTGTDGLFGTLYVFTCKGDDTPVGFLLCGSIDECFATEEELFNNFVSSFDGMELSKEEFNSKSNLNSLSNKVILSNELRTAGIIENNRNVVPNNKDAERSS